MRYLKAFVIIIFILTISGNVEISFMKGAQWLNNPIYCDYYFACQAEGEVLQWKVSNNNISNYFGQSAIGQVFNRSISNCNYITTLLSLKPLSTGQSMFGSVLIVSCHNSTNFNFDVICTNGSVSNMMSNPEKELNTMAETNIPSVILEHVLTETLLYADSSSCTNIFVCGVDNSFLTIGVESNSFGFTIFNDIGRPAEMISDTTVESQAILTGKTPYRLVIAVLVINREVTNVTCGYDENTASITSMKCQNNLVTTETGTSTDHESATTASPNGNDRAFIITLSIICAALIASISCGIIVVLIIIHYINNNNSQSSPADATDGSNEEVETPWRDNDFSGIKETKMMINNIGFYEPFLQRIEYIFLSQNLNTFNAASTIMTAPDIENGSDKITAISENVYIGMLEGYPVCLVKGTEVDFIKNLKDIIIKHICNAKYLLFTGPCLAFNQEKTKLADILISSYIVDEDNKAQPLSPEMRTKFCFFPQAFKGFQVAAKRHAEHSVAVMISGRNLTDNEKYKKIGYKQGYEESCGDLLSLYMNGVDMGKNTTKEIQVIIVGAVTGYVNGKSYNEWEFMASQAAFYYIASKMRCQDICNSISYNILKTIPKRENYSCKNFCEQVKYIISVLSKDAFDAATTIMTAPNDEDGIVEISNGVYIGMIESHPVGLLQLRHCCDMEKAVEEYFTNANCIVNVGGCAAISQDRANLGDVVISKEIHHIYSNGTDSVEILKPQISNIFCNISNVEDFIIPGDVRVKYRPGRIASWSKEDRKEIDEEMKKKATSSPDNLAYENLGGEHLCLQKNMEKKGRHIHVVIINGVTCYADSAELFEWHFVASQVAFHYLHCKMKQL